jgi:hypothetical protein
MICHIIFIIRQVIVEKGMGITSAFKKLYPITAIVK